jgi:thiol-disulfide isomerase/thioredoxin
LNKPFPALEVEGWINGPGPTAEQLSNQVLVIDAWAYWCGPCRMVIPTLQEIHEKYKDRGVTVIGLTAESGNPASLQQSQAFVEKLNIPWPNGYGAIKPLVALNVEAIPQLWIVDRQNKIVFHEIGWNPNSPAEIEEAVVKALESSSDQRN